MGELAREWEKDSLLRSRGRQNTALLVWPDKKSTSIPSMKACKLNVRALEVTALWWAQQQDVPASIPIDDMRVEAGTPHQTK